MGIVNILFEPCFILEELDEDKSSHQFLDIVACVFLCQFLIAFCILYKTIYQIVLILNKVHKVLIEIAIFIKELIRKRFYGECFFQIDCS